MHCDALKQLTQTAAAVSDAVRGMGLNIEWMSWQQLWPNTSCGFGGLCGQAFTSACTVIATAPDSDTVRVYHQGTFAYEVKRPSQTFWQLCGERSLPGQTDKRDHLEMLDPEAQPLPPKPRTRR
jgi:hypothetical protein